MKDNVTIITGASKGIGAELARQLAAKGAKLVLAARHERELETVAGQCRALGAAVVAVKADVAVERDCQGIIAGAAIAFGRIDTLVNNAGISMWARCIARGMPCPTSPRRAGASSASRASRAARGSRRAPGMRRANMR